MSFLGCRHTPPPRTISPITRYRTNVHLHLTMNLTLTFQYLTSHLWPDLWPLTSVYQNAISLNLCLYWIVFYMYVYSLAYHKLIQMVIYNVIYIHRMYAKFEYVCCVTCISKILYLIWTIQGEKSNRKREGSLPYSHANIYLTTRIKM